MFFGTVVRPGATPTPLVPHPAGHVLHLSQAALTASAKENARASLLIAVKGEQPIVLATLCAGVTDTVLLDQFIDAYCELTVEGGAEVHLTGYYSPQFAGEEDEEEEEGEDGEYELGGDDPLAHLAPGQLDLALRGRGYRMPAAAGGSSDSEDEGEGDSDEEEDLSSLDDGEDASDDGLVLPSARSKAPSVVIEDITDSEPTKPLANGAAKQQPQSQPQDKQQAQGTQQAAAEAGKKRKAEGQAAADAGSVPKKQQQALKQEQQAQQPMPKQGGKKQQQQQAKQQQQTPQPGPQPAKADKQQQQHKQGAAKTPQQAGTPAALELPGSSKKVKRFENGFEIHSTKMGDPHGKLAKPGKTVKVKYVGKLTNGKVFDKSGNKPFAFRLGIGEVIKGWDRGVEGMRVGDKRRLVIPPAMAYGTQKLPGIPPNSTLDFDVELVDVK